MDIQIKKHLAREILLLFGSLILIGISLLFLITRNYYYEHKVNINTQNIHELNIQLDSFPKDRIKSLYEGIKHKLIENYQIGTDKYAILKEEENDFLKDFPNAKHLNHYENGFSYFIGHYPYEKENHSISFLAIPPTKKTNRTAQDSMIIFDYVDLIKFRELIAIKDYRDKFFSTFSTVFDLGTHSEYEIKITNGLEYKQSKVDSLLANKALLLSQIEADKDAQIEGKEFNKFILWISIIFGFTIYPLRICFFLVKWAIKTLKPNTIKN